MKRLLKLGLALGLTTAFAFIGCKYSMSEPALEIKTFTGTPYKELPAGTDGTLGKTGRYVLFGDWPQTIKADDVVIDEYVISYMGMFTYYKGSDDAWYVKIKENAYPWDGNKKRYSNGSEVARAQADSYKYFKVEPIKWRILTDDYNGKKLLLAETILTGHVSYYDYEANKIIDGTTIYSNNYKESRIRAWLNGLSYYVTASGADIGQSVNREFQDRGFLQTAFTETIRTKIATDTTIDNSPRSSNTAANANQWNNGNNKYACANTTDSIFLLSEQEVTKSDYGFSAYDVYKGDSNGTTESSRIRMTSDFAKANFVEQYEENGGSCWWLRSPRHDSNDVRLVDEYGFTDFGINSLVTGANVKNNGVCPALSLKY